MSPFQSNDSAFTNDRIEVQLVAGSTIEVLTQKEADWFIQSRDSYLEQTKFTETTDLRDLDRLLTHELMVFRWTQYLAAGVDYIGFPTDDDSEQLRRNIKEYSDQINKIKDSMGLNKKARDDAANDGNFATWLADLKSRAKVFGVHRENQLVKALTLMNELSGVVTSFQRADEEERRKLGFENEHEIIEWITHHMLPQFHEVDEHFRTHEQRYWIRDQ